MKTAVAVFVLAEPFLIACRGFLRRQQPAGLIHQALFQQQCQQLYQPGAAKPLGFPAADHGQLRAVSGPADIGNRPGSAGHAAANPRSFEGRAGGHRTADETLPAAQGHLSVGAHIQKQTDIRLLPQAGGQQPCHDVPAHIGRGTGGRPGFHALDLFCLAPGKQALRPEGGHRQSHRGQAHKDMLHHGVSRDV